MSTEVSGEAEGVTLIEAIEAGRIATPGELSFPQWQAWRKGPGMRPTMRRDGRGISTRDEVDLWRRVMEHLYGAGRAGELEEEDDGPEGREVALQGSASGAPSVAASEGERRDEGRGSPSSAGSAGAASARSLQAKLKALYDPSAEDLGAYLMRMGRTIEALTTLDAARMRPHLLASWHSVPGRLNL